MPRPGNRKPGLREIAEREANRRSPRRSVYAALALLFIIGCVSGSIVVKDRYDTYRAQKTAEEAVGKLNSMGASPTPAPAPETASPSPSASAPPVSPSGPVLSTEPPAPAETPPRIQRNFQELREQYGNDDIVGYLNIPGTTIDYLVMYSGDNDFYLHRDINKEYSFAGSIFMDMDNDAAAGGYNTILYGHNMKAEIMFHDLRLYQSRDFMESHRYVTFNTVYRNMTWEVFSFYMVDYNDFPFTRVDFADDDEFYQFALQMKERSMYDTGVDVAPGDRVLTLQTCSEIGSADNRFILEAKLITTDGQPYPAAP